MVSPDKEVQLLKILTRDTAYIFIPPPSILGKGGGKGGIATRAVISLVEAWAALTIRGDLLTIDTIVSEL